MFWFSKKKKQNEYLLSVAAILQQSIGSAFNTLGLARECYAELRANISKGIFHDGVDPKPKIMAYYSICSMVNETGSSDDRTMVLKLSVIANILKGDLEPYESMTALEKGIWHFGEQVLEGGLTPPLESDVAKIKSDAVQIIMGLMQTQDAPAVEQDVRKIVANVSKNVGDREVSKVGERVLAMSVMSNATGYYIDQGNKRLAQSYYKCIGLAYTRYFNSSTESYSKHQAGALEAILRDYESLAKELLS